MMLHIVVRVRMIINWMRWDTVLVGFMSVSFEVERCVSVDFMFILFSEWHDISKCILFAPLFRPILQ